MQPALNLHHTLRHLILLAVVLAIFPANALFAEDRDGLRFDFSKKTVSRSDGPGDYVREIDRDLILKATLKNVSMKDREAGKVKYIILIRRWGNEVGTVDKYEGTVDLPALKRAEQTELKTDSFHIGGHMHGTSKMHVDEMVGWKFEVSTGSQITEFASSTSFESLLKRASKGS